MSARDAVARSLLAAVIIASCSVPTTHLVATRSTGPDGGAGDAATVPDGMTSSSCLQTTFDLTHPAGNILLLVDRSAAMDTPNDGTCSSCGTFWSTLGAAVETLTTSTSNHFHWALKLFPSGDTDACSVTTGPEVAISEDGGHAAIASLLASTQPAGASPVTSAVDRADSYFSGLQDDDPKFILLAIGGSPTCGSNDPTVGDLSAAIDEVERIRWFTYVLGFGAEQATFAKLAAVGATGSAYSAAQISSLLTDMEDLAKALASCTFAIPGGALGGRSISVQMDDAPLTRGDMNGFSVSSDGTTIRIQGDPCFNTDAYSSLTIKVDCSE
jgi:hypothetical protein